MLLVIKKYGIFQFALSKKHGNKKDLSGLWKWNYTHTHLIETESVSQ